MADSGFFFFFFFCIKTLLNITQCSCLMDALPSRLRAAGWTTQQGPCCAQSQLRKISLTNAGWWPRVAFKPVHLFWSKQKHTLLKNTSKWLSEGYFGNWRKFEFQTLPRKISRQRLAIGEKRIPPKLQMDFAAVSWGAIIQIYSPDELS